MERVLFSVSELTNSDCIRKTKMFDQSSGVGIIPGHPLVIIDYREFMIEFLTSIH